MTETLLAVVEVDKANRVICQAEGCGHGVYRRIHVVRHDDGTVGVYGSGCFGRLFGHLEDKPPRYGTERSRADRRRAADARREHRATHRPVRWRKQPASGPNGSMPRLRRAGRQLWQSWPAGARGKGDGPQEVQR